MLDDLTIHAISDLHGHFPRPRGGDILIVGGDHGGRDTTAENARFCQWLKRCCEDYEHVVYIGGNHDNHLYRRYPDGYPLALNLPNCHYLCDSKLIIDDLILYGTPHVPRFYGMNPLCMAFTCACEDQLERMFSSIPENVDILITHTPPDGILDENIRGDNCGSTALKDRITKIRPRLLLFGHIHEQGGKETSYRGIRCLNTSYVDEKYRPRKDFPFI